MNNFEKEIESPYYNTGKAILKKRKEKVRYKNTNINYTHFYYQDEKTGLKFTTTAIGNENLRQIYDKYEKRKKSKFKNRNLRQIKKKR